MINTKVDIVYNVYVCNIFQPIYIFGKMILNSLYSLSSLQIFLLQKEKKENEVNLKRIWNLSNPTIFFSLLLILLSRCKEFFYTHHSKGALRIFLFGLVKIDSILSVSSCPVSLSYFCECVCEAAPVIERWKVYKWCCCCPQNRLRSVKFFIINSNALNFSLSQLT